MELNPSSPHSSSGAADSLKGTPDTRLTAFSPQESSAKSYRLLKPLTVGTSRAIPLHLSGTGPVGNMSSDKDPFVSPKSTLGSQLSPTASAFHPYSGNFAAASAPSQDSHANDMAQSPESVSGQSIQLFHPDRNLSLHDATSFLEKLERLGLLVPGTRHLAVQNGNVFVRFGDAKSAAAVLDNAFRHGHHVMAAYADGFDWPTSRLHAKASEERLRVTADIPSHLSSKGRISILACAIASLSLDIDHIESSICELLQAEGQLKDFHRLPSLYGPAVYHASAEYVVEGDADNAVARHNGCNLEGVVIHLAHIQKDETGFPAASVDVSSPERSLAASMHTLSISEASHQDMPNLGTHNDYSHQSMGSQQAANPPPIAFQMQHPFTMWPVLCQPQMQPNLAYVLDSHRPFQQSSSSGMGHFQVAAPMLPRHSHSFQMSDDYAQPRTMPGLSRPDSRRQHAARVSRSSFYSMATHHNHVDVVRIREGIDVRTTIMLRNIPNKVDQAMLKRIVDESSWGKYDFMYLRIDFANDCNVGYAFINFVDPLDIIDFVNARGNQRWNCFKSDKVAEISYATIQGKDCLVQKFRNSSVMLEAAHYRPKLYHTSNGPSPELAGQEETFPPPDNQSKMKRSCENAEHVGLFTPNAGQHFRDEQRRRRSQYDRGTRLAALEEQDFEAAIQPYLHFQQ